MEKGPKTPKFSKSALPWENPHKMELVNLGGGVGVGVRIRRPRFQHYLKLRWTGKIML